VVARSYSCNHGEEWTWWPLYHQLKTFVRKQFGGRQTIILKAIQRDNLVAARLSFQKHLEKTILRLPNRHLKSIVRKQLGDHHIIFSQPW
jgi:hypothetical protein